MLKLSLIGFLILYILDINYILTNYINKKIKIKSKYILIKLIIFWHHQRPNQKPN